MRYNTIKDFIDEEVSIFYDEEVIGSELERLENAETPKVYELDNSYIKENSWGMSFYEINVDESESVYVEFDCNGYGSDSAFYGEDGDILPEYDDDSDDFCEEEYVNPNPRYKHEMYARLMKDSKPISNWYGYDLDISNEDWRPTDYDNDAHFEYFYEDYTKAQYLLYKYLEKKYKEGIVISTAA